MSSPHVVDGRVPERDRDPTTLRPLNARPRDRFGRPLAYGLADEMADRREPEEVVASVAEALVEAARLFDEQRFFEAHEFLEYIWKSDEVMAPDRSFWKGVTQVAVGCAHTQRGNARGAVTLLERARGYMAPYPAAYQGVDAAALAAGAGQVVAQVRERGPSPDLDFPRFPLAD